MNLRRLLGSVVVIGLGATAALAGCAVGDDPSSSDNSTSSSGNGGAGADGGMGGMGGMGGDPSPCKIDCSAVNTDQCHEVICNEATRNCEVVAVTNGTSCDDSLFCTVNDSCQEGICQGGPQNDCGMDPPDCNGVMCNESGHTCSFVPANDTTPCQPSDLCVVGASCSNGLCLGGSANTCFFAPVPNECHVSVCNPANGMCEPVPGNDGMTCVDQAALCDVGKTCSLGTCQGGGPKDCSGLTMGCFDGVCDTTSGLCTQVAIMPGQQCAGATDQCNVGICDMNGGCNPQPANEGQNCDTDGCFIGQTCATGACQGGAEITACANGDNCCPAGCDLNNDDDCGCDFGLISDDALLADPLITGVITANGHTFVVHNNNNTGTHTSNMALLNQYETIIMQTHDRVITTAEMNNLTAWVQAGGRLLVTGYDSLGSPTDANLASVVNCLGPADGPFIGALVVTNATHPIMQGPAQAFTLNATMTAGSTDHDTCNPGPGSVQLVTVDAISSKLLVTDNVGVGLGRVIYWNGNGASAGALADWNGSAGTQPALQNLFINVLDHMCH